MDMTRTAARELALRLTFALFENPADPDALLSETLSGEYYATLEPEDELYRRAPGEDARAYLSHVVRGVFEHGAELDRYIEKYAVGWEFHRISRTAAAVMRIVMFEALYMQDIPLRASMNEAVELAKKYASDESPAYVNGVLREVLKELNGVKKKGGL
jgi:N utilization substance protein B